MPSTIIHNVVVASRSASFHLSQYSAPCISTTPLTTSTYISFRLKSSSSSARWTARQTTDKFRKEAVVNGLKSRAAFKLLELNQKHRLFKPGGTTVDLGYAPGSWSQVAVNRSQPGGRVIGVDLIPALPPAGVSTIQGNFLSPDIQAEVRSYVRDPALGVTTMRARAGDDGDGNADDVDAHATEGLAHDVDRGKEGQGDGKEGVAVDGGVEDIHVDQDGAVPTTTITTKKKPVEVVQPARGYLDRSAKLETKNADAEPSHEGKSADAIETKQDDSDAKKKRKSSLRERDLQAGRVVDVVLSDMSAPWPQINGYAKNSVNNIYHRLMNTSGNSFHDHVKSMDLCIAALTFAFDTLKTGGHFVCKYYQGAEEKEFEGRLKKLFEKVHREKPEASRKESKEGFFVALRRKEATSRDQVFP